VIPVPGYEDRRVGVLGLGRSGLAAARALREGGAVPVCWDDNEGPRAKAEAEGFTVEDLTRERPFEDMAALVMSPGVPHLYPAPHPAAARAMAAGVPLDNDIGLFFAAMTVWAPEEDDEGDADPRIVCVTGSNGKSTTAALIHHILKSAGRLSQLGGNIGRGVLDLDPPRCDETVVLELSSYQTELARRLAPDVAVFLNLSPDHLDRHGGMGGYFAAKRRLFEAGAPETAVIGVDETEGLYLRDRAALFAERVISISGARALKGEGWSVSFRKNHLAEWRTGKQAASFDLREAPALPGAHNGQNACAAWAACRALGLGPRQIEAGLRSYPGLPHRLEKLGEAGGVAFVNDSKATNADAAEKALLAFDRIRWIAGGVPKAGGIAPLAPLFGRVVKAYLIGEAAEAFAATLGETPHEIAGDLAAAAARAAAEAQPGETILLAPACASFDQFASFEARGDAFRALAAELMRKKEQA